MVARALFEYFNVSFVGIEISLRVLWDDELVVSAMKEKCRSITLFGGYFGIKIGKMEASLCMYSLVYHGVEHLHELWRNTHSARHALYNPVQLGETAIEEASRDYTRVLSHVQQG